jgi:hypothetical protein
MFEMFISSLIMLAGAALGGAGGMLGRTRAARLACVALGGSLAIASTAISNALVGGAG